LKKWLATVLLFSLTAYVLWQLITENQTVATGAKIGMKAPDFALQTLDGQTLRLSDLHGKPVIVNFWATWCPPCRAEMPDMQKFYEKYHKKMEIVAVNLMVRDSREKVDAFIKEYGLTFPVVLDTKGAAMKQYEIQPIPTSFIIDKDGIIRDKFVGPMPYKKMVEYMEQWGE
jgi:cytochrome c biogenesis protein CcmG/thiol:disulfide interchange protein DsbE